MGINKNDCLKELALRGFLSHIKLNYGPMNSSCCGYDKELVMFEIYHYLDGNMELLSLENFIEKTDIMTILENEPLFK
jgi:hypothetical protein